MPGAQDRYGNRYRGEVRRALGFLGPRHDFFVEAKARELLRIVAQHVGDPSELRALDVGSGIGLFDRFLVPHFAAVDGIDVSREAIESAKRRNASARYRHYDGGELPFDGRAFDVVFAVCVLQVVPALARRQLVAEMSRVVTRGGLVVVFEHNPVNPLTRIAANRFRLGGKSALLGRGAVARLFTDSGLEVVDSRYIVFFPWRSQALDRLERRLTAVPLGAQYVLAGSLAE